MTTIKDKALVHLAVSECKKHRGVFRLTKESVERWGHRVFRLTKESVARWGHRVFRLQGGMYRDAKILFSLLLLIVSSHLILAYSFKDAVNEIGPGTKGVSSAREMISFWKKASGNLSYSPSANAFIDFLNRTFEEFNFQKLFKSSYLTGSLRGIRSISFAGTNLPNTYRISLLNGSYKSVSLNKIGNFGAEFSLKKNKVSIVGEPSYSAYVKGIAAFKQFSHINATAFLGGLQKVIDPENIKTLNAPSSEIYGNIGGNARKLLNQFALDYPNFSKAMYKYTGLSSLVTIKTHEGKSYTHLKMIGLLKLESLKNDFPEIAEYIEDMEGVVRFRFNFYNKAKKLIMSFRLNSKTRAIYWSIYTKNGKIIPSDKNGNPIFEEAFSLSKISDYPFYIVSNFVFNLYGLTIDTGNVYISSHYQKKANNGTLNFSLNYPPKPKITGAFYHIIPTWLIDIGIPGNIDELAAKFSKVIAKGNNGKGSYLSMNWNTKRANNTIMTSSGATELLDNRFVNFAMKIWAKKIKPSEDAFKSLRKFTAFMNGELLKDLK